MAEKLSVRGKDIDGVVVSAKAKKVVCIRKDTLIKVRKYERYAKVMTKILARVPEDLDVKVGDTVRASECRRTGKDVAFVVTKKLS
ncbi:MAG: 30S ribosomal protein S17 [Candidatus Altarchaeum sp. CG12_big_fil_rev_8_21_14_0_65_33_22]|nr:MAG: 30S ribosomal protein S17 [Candidatus Altarchaeum sp. CG2_30_32_3053]PIN67181.1 MAG: 30S ribosomal protein S17 [Candidatus Altarchaeum sp. CG12_big_fil_rev_8_21_14_0_65_33_22]